MGITAFIDRVAQWFDLLGVAVLVLGLLWALWTAAQVWRSTDGRRGYRTLRETFGGVLLVGLEILVAADLIRTVAVRPTLQNVAVLGLIVLIRTFLSVSLQVEIEGQPPWRRAATGGASVLGRAAARARASTGDDPPPAGT